MGVLRYIPKVKEVIDNRSPDGGYYEAECNECGNIFYPKRSNAKYCSRSCLVMHYRKEQKKTLPKNSEKKIIKLGNKIFEGGGLDMARFLKDKYFTATDFRPIYIIKKELFALSYGEKIQYNTLTVIRRSERLYGLFERV